jgi:hypothetical protein
MKRILLALSLIISFTIVSCDQSQAPSGPSSNPMSKATVTRDLPFSTTIHNTCCWEDEWVTVSGTMKLVENDNGAHAVIKGLTGTCIWGGHTYTAEGASNLNVTMTDNQYSVVATIKLTANEGCSVTVKIHYKFVYDTTNGWTLQFDKSELICEGDTNL